MAEHNPYGAGAPLEALLGLPPTPAQVAAQAAYDAHVRDLAAQSLAFQRELLALQETVPTQQLQARVEPTTGESFVYGPRDDPFGPGELFTTPIPGTPTIRVEPLRVVEQKATLGPEMPQIRGKPLPVVSQVSESPISSFSASNLPLFEPFYGVRSRRKAFRRWGRKERFE